MRRHTGLWLAVAILLTTASALAGEVSDRARFQLWNKCRPINLVVEDLTDDAATIGLTEEKIEVSVRSRFRGARIYDGDAKPYLYVNVHVLSPAFTVSMEFQRYASVSVEMPFWTVPEELADKYKLSGIAATWRWEKVGLHGSSDSANFILGSVSLVTDKFIDEYLRVNADDCCHVIERSCREFGTELKLKRQRWRLATGPLLGCEAGAMFSGNQMTLDVEGVVDGGVGGEKPLR